MSLGVRYLVSGVALAILGILSLAGCKVPVTGSGVEGNGITLTSISPVSTPVGSPAFTLTVNGTGFAPGATVRWDGLSRPTSEASSTQLHASITAADLSSQRSVKITVANPDGGQSNSLQFFVGTAPTPSIGKIVPDHALAGSAAFTLDVQGTKFESGSVVQWNGEARPTTFGSATDLTAQITAKDVLNPGQGVVTVLNPEGTSSNAVVFAINAPGPVLITLKQFLFNPREVIVSPGTQLEWTNEDNTLHTVSRDLDTLPGPDKPALNPGDSYTFTVPATVPTGTDIFYHCNIHGAPGNGTTFGPGMTAVIHVR